MSAPNLLGTGSKRLTTRKRVQGRTKPITEVTAAVTQANLPTPVYGCEPDILAGTLLAEPEELKLRLTRKEKETMMAKSRRKMEELPTLVIENISYTIFSHEDLKKAAVFEVKNTDLSGLHSVNDPRSGVVDNDDVCKTCYLDNMECPGHFGIINLNTHIIHPMFRREVIDVLTAVCNSCGGLLLTADTIHEKGLDKLSGSKRLRAIADESKKLPCRRSQENVEAGASACVPNPEYRASKAKEMGKIIYSYDGKKGKDNERTVEDVEQILDAISEEDAELLGFSGESHPRRFIMKSLPVIPICARAPAFQDGEILNDDITIMYLDIVRYNQELLRPDLTEKDHEKIVSTLTYYISHMIDNSDGQYKQGKRKVNMDIKSRIQGKEAMIRALIQGKRVNYSGRTVLGPDPNLKFGQIRIPRIWAPYLTQVEEVSAANLGRLMALFKAGKITYVTPARGKLQGRKLKVTPKLQAEYNLTFGDSVDRWLQDGDYVVFNRQPTLHKQGIMGYEVVLGDPMTIGMHLSYTNPHNAD